jgi:hypothetical protein
MAAGPRQLAEQMCSAADFSSMATASVRKAGARSVTRICPKMNQDAFVLLGKGGN